SQSPWMNTTGVLPEALAAAISLFSRSDIDAIRTPRLSTFQRNLVHRAQRGEVTCREDCFKVPADSEAPPNETGDDNTSERNPGWWRPLGPNGTLGSWRVCRRGL